MPVKPKTACFKCGKAAESGTICKACKPDHQQTLAEKNKARNQDPDNAKYHTMDWIRYSRLLRDCNIQCQRLEKDGKQCRYPSQLVHHLLSPRKHPSLFFNPSNCVCICRFHHPDSEGENPSKLHKYVPTLWKGESFPHMDSFGQPFLPNSVATGIDNWLRSMQSNAKPL
jgi:hypothetical protein